MFYSATMVHDVMVIDNVGACSACYACGQGSKRQEKVLRWFPQMR